MNATKMPPKNDSKKTSRKRRTLQRDRVGDLYADVPDPPDKAMLRVSFRRSWYSPPFTEDGEVDLDRAVEELSEELTGGVLVLAKYLENGELGYRAEIPVASKDDLERLLRTIRKLFVESLKHDNAIRQTAIDVCRSLIAEEDDQAAEPGDTTTDRRTEADRRTRQRRGRQLLGRLFFRKDDRRMEDDRRTGKDRRAA